MKHLFTVFLIGILAFAASCATKGRDRVSLNLPDSESPKELSLNESGFEQIQYRTLKVTSEMEGRALVENKRSFLLDLFKQSEDPYFGTPRWSTECLKRNQIGKLESRGREISFSAQVTVDKRWNVGDCTDGGRDALLQVKYCGKQSQAVVIFITGSKAVEAEVLCAEPFKISF